MTARLLVVILCSLAVQGCGTMAYKPTEYPLREGLIPEFKLTGDVSVSNAQPSTDRTIVYSYFGTKLGSDLNTITEVMVQQTIKELEKNGQKVDGGSPKSIGLKVNSLRSKYTFAMFWKSKMNFEATLGDGQVIEMTVPHSSGVLQQDLNGCIAESVMHLLNDERVTTYLGQ